ncbi:uncharacterized protein METZ01_LOCUS214743 [marine metagenome]|uniref:Uncharacterized protein n=1 Tax=marine metagenome TaxID=408172 RepID=A0A382FGV8_9ZZZZ
MSFIYGTFKWRREPRFKKYRESSQKETSLSISGIQ